MVRKNLKLMINWRKPLISALLYATGSKLLKYLKEIERISQFSSEEKTKYQERKLRALLLHAYRNVPYYSRVLGEAGVVRGDTVDLERFSNVPLLTKAIIRREGKNLYSRDYERRGYQYNATGGSTGEPIQFIQDPRHTEWGNATRLFEKTVVGQNIGDREVRMTNVRSDLGDIPVSMKARLVKKLKNWLYNRRDLSICRLSEETMRSYANVCRTFKPTFMFGFVHAYLEFARFIRDNGLPVFSPRGVLTTAGVLHPETKRVIQEAFSCPVYNGYGSEEFVSIAFGKGLLDVCFWLNKVEILDDDGMEAHSGKLIVTGLSNYAMPFIRCDTGDVGVAGAQPFTLESVQGRVNSYFKKKDGEKINGYIFTHELWDKSWCKNFWIVQEDYERIAVTLVGDKDERECRHLEDTIKGVMGQECVVTISFVDDLPPTKKGKYVQVESRLS